MRIALLIFICSLLIGSILGAQIGFRNRRNPDGYVKGHRTPQAPRLSNLELNLKKGEYVCGNKVCKLRPGEVPPGCNGICQYPIH